MFDTQPKLEVKVCVPVIPWLPPSLAYQVALSMDGSFLSQDGTAAAVMVLRRHDGSVIFAA